jgi:regulatory protein
VSDVVEITSEDGPVFFIRLAYLQSINPDSIQVGAVFEDAELDELVEAGLAFAAERKAEEYLARCEQCRRGLERKLAQKKMSANSIKAALDYLEGRELLSDRRFAFSWVRSHTINKPQGRTRLLSELCSRGISTQDAKIALDEFFADVDELELCERAYKKALRNGKTGEKLLKSMIDSGFSYKMIKKIETE